MTMLIISINILIFGYFNVLNPSSVDALFSNHGVIPGLFDLHNPVQTDPSVLLTLFTSMFLHGGWLHLIFNMWALWLFGDNVEDRMGPLGFLAFYLLAGVFAAVTHIYVNAGSTIPTVGASGAIAAVMGAYVVMFPQARILTLVPLFVIFWMMEIPAYVYLGLWFILQFLQGAGSLGGDQAQIAFWAHIGGFLFGVFLYRLFLFRPKTPDRRIL
ncbi:MAG: rhomboid family intramembrane serine protease [Solirubrobacterales bacterium]